MRKKSHILLARYLADQMQTTASLQSHRKAFCLGSILPDIKPSFITRRHEFYGTFEDVKNRMKELADIRPDESNQRVYWRRFGEVIHYMADYFTFPHNKTYTGSFSQHNHYEKVLKNRLKECIQQGEAHAYLEPAIRFADFSTLIDYIEATHEKYLNKLRSVEEDWMTAMRSEQQVEAALKSYEDVDSWKTIIFLYNAALKEVGTKLEILNDEFQHVHQYNPIEHIKTRIKTPDSIVKKLKRYGHETSIENMVRYVNDIAGVRLICSFTSDIYRLAEMIGNQSDLKVLSIKDYIKNPKESGYKSYHMLVSVPIFLSDSVVDTKVEIQIRTIAMDFWASLEHKIYYKFEGNAPEYISKDLQECAKMVSELDDKMLSLNEAIQECIAQQDKDQIRMNEELMNDVCRDVLGNNKEYKDSKVQEKVTEIVT